jgi:hypothetical protein
MATTAATEAAAAAEEALCLVRPTVQQVERYIDIVRFENNNTN